MRLQLQSYSQVTSKNVQYKLFFCIVLKEQSFKRKSSGDALVDPPVPIPNTVVKHQEAESTCLETGWEDRKLLVVMAALVKWLTHWIVAPACMGSTPISRPIS